METSTQKKLVVGATGFLIVLAAYGIYWYMTREKSTSGESWGGFSNKKTPMPSVFPLRQGSRGKEVGKLQVALNQKLSQPFSQLVVDEQFGSKTLRALKNITGKESLSQSEYSQLITSISPF